MSISRVFMQVISSGAQAVAAGNWHSMVLKLDGSFWGTGANLYGQLGDGSTVGTNTFVQVAPSYDGMCCVVLRAFFECAFSLTVVDFSKLLHQISGVGLEPFT